jgi:hypothetical protein
MPYMGDIVLTVELIVLAVIQLGSCESHQAIHSIISSDLAVLMAPARLIRATQVVETLTSVKNKIFGLAASRLSRDMIHVDQSKVKRACSETSCHFNRYWHRPTRQRNLLLDNSSLWHALSGIPDW